MARFVPFWFLVFASLVAPACSSDDSDDDGSGSGGRDSMSGGGTGGAGPTGGSGGGAAEVDCAAVCERVRTICEGQSTIDDNWVDVCTRACEIRVEVAPETAVLERDCVNAATTCTVAVLCVSSPGGTGGSGGSGG